MNHRPLKEHANIVGLLGYGWGLSRDNVLPFLVTEYADCGNLRKFLLNAVQTPVLSIVSRMKVAGGIASGLHALHSCGIAYGDIKLENVLVFRHASEDDGREMFLPKLVSPNLLSFS